MKQKLKIWDKVMKALASFTVSYAFAVIAYVLISMMGVFTPIDNDKALQLMWICLAVAVVHFALGFLELSLIPWFCIVYFIAEVAVVLFMGTVVFDFVEMSVSFFVCLMGMLIVVYVGTYLIAYFDVWKNVQEINEIIKKNKK